LADSHFNLVKAGARTSLLQFRKKMRTAQSKLVHMRRRICQHPQPATRNIRNPTVFAKLKRQQAVPGTHDRTKLLTLRLYLLLYEYPDKITKLNGSVLPTPMAVSDHHSKVHTFYTLRTSKTFVEPRILMRD